MSPSTRCNPGCTERRAVIQLYGAEAPGPVGEPDDFGGVVAFLCSEHAKFLTGAAIHVDGGSYAALL